MVTNDDIFLAILAMDVYHTGKNTPPVGGKDAVGPGYLHNLKGVDETKGIGVATRINQFAHGTYGFFAASYAWNGKTVISYRGTDQSFSSGPDVDHGYSVSVGSPYGGQAQQAIDFYVRTAGRTPNNSNVIVTGQSLGGGLAGLIGRIYRADTVMFNNMNFELAAHNAHDYSVGTVVYTGGEPTYLEDPALKQKIYGDLAPWDVTAGGDRMRAFSMQSELLSYSRIIPFGRPGYEIALDPLGNLWKPGNPTYLGSDLIPGFLEERGERHTSAPLIIRMFGDLSRSSGGPKTDDWQSVMKYIWKGLYTVDAARAIGIGELGGADAYDYGPHWTMHVMIAYSAISEGTTVFGDSAIRALYDDASDVGLATKGDAASFLKSEIILEALGQIAAQFAGDLARAKVDRAQKLWAADGTFTLSADQKILSADLDPEKWQSTFNKGSQTTAENKGQERIIGVESLLEALRVKNVLEDLFSGIGLEVNKAVADWQPSTKRITFFGAGAKEESANLDASTLIKITKGIDGNDRTAVPNAADGEKGGVVLLGTAKDDSLAGGAGSDLLYAGDGQDMVFRSDAGKTFDLYFLGYGADKYFFNPIMLAGSGTHEPTGKAVVFGGPGNDIADYLASERRVYFEEVRKGENLGAYRVTYLSDKGKADDQVEFVDYLFSFDKVDGGQAADLVTIPKPIKSFLEQLNELGKSIADFFIDLGGQNPEKAGPGGGTSQSSSDVQGKHGDLIDFSDSGTPEISEANGQQQQSKGIVADLGDEDKQFAADVQGALPTRLGLAGQFPTAGLWQQLKFYNLVKAELDTRTDLDNYATDARLNLKNAESVIGTDYNDLIIGADTVYTWKLPDPPPPSTDPNAPPPPPPEPQKVVDKDFAGYDLIGGKGDDTIIIYKGDKDQLSFHDIEGGEGRDVIAVRIDGKTEYKDPATGEITKSTIDGGQGDDAIFVLGGGKGLQVAGGLGRDFIYVKPNPQVNTSDDGRKYNVDVYGDTIDRTYEKPVLDANGNPVLDASGKPVTETNPVEDSKANADLFWYTPGVTIKDAQHHDILSFFGMPLTGGNIAAGGAFAEALTSIGGYTGGGLALAGFASTVAAHQGPTGGLFWDNLVPFITYIY